MLLLIYSLGQAAGHALATQQHLWLDPRWLRVAICALSRWDGDNGTLICVNDVYNENLYSINR